MTAYLQECYLSSGREGPDPHTREQVAALGASSGHPGPRLLGTVVVPADETLFLLWQADSADAVRTVASRAGLACDRVTEVVVLLPGSPEPG